MTTPNDWVHESEKVLPIERAKNADLMMGDIILSSSDIDKIWAKEVPNRWNAYKRGEVKSIPYDEVIYRYKKS